MATAAGPLLSPLLVVVAGVEGFDLGARVGCGAWMSWFAWGAKTDAGIWRKSIKHSESALLTWSAYNRTLFSEIIP